MQYVGQQAILRGWITAEKNNIEKVVKTRLIERDFEEGNSKVLKDSPACTIKIMILIPQLPASIRWTDQVIDIKSAFHQGR